MGKRTSHCDNVRFNEVTWQCNCVDITCHRCRCVVVEINQLCFTTVDISSARRPWVRLPRCHSVVKRRSHGHVTSSGVSEPVWTDPRCLPPLDSGCENWTVWDAAKRAACRRGCWRWTCSTFLWSTRRYASIDAQSICRQVDVLYSQRSNDTWRYETSTDRWLLPVLRPHDVCRTSFSRRTTWLCGFWRHDSVGDLWSLSHPVYCLRLHSAGRLGCTGQVSNINTACYLCDRCLVTMLLCGPHYGAAMLHPVCLSVHPSRASDFFEIGKP